MNFFHFGLCAMVFFVVGGGVLAERGGGSCSMPKLKNGRIRSRQRGKVIKFVCLSGFQLAGERNAFCANGTWDMPTPKCVKPSACVKKDAPPANGLILSSHGGGVLNFYCKQGYELLGPAAVFCDGAAWDNHMPSCIPLHTKPSLFCDFEDANICHWTHDLNHDMDWKRDSYKTPTGYSMETGPSHDHTKGTGENGHYMYIESSSRRRNDTARLISPIFDKTTSNTCLEFWYHMYGKTTGTLRAYMKKVTDPWPLQADTAIFSKTGNQGNVWYRAIIDLGTIDQDYQIIMEGVRGNGYVSDTAIDDIKIIENCVYDDYLVSTTEIPLPGTEILKSVDTCQNRCGNRSSGIENSQIIPCDCDDYCYENSRCCPDFFDVCFSSSSTLDFDTTTEWQKSTSDMLPVPSNSTVKNATVERENATKIPIAIPQTHSAVTVQMAFSTPVKKIITPVKPLIIPIPVPTRRPLVIVRPVPTTAIYRKYGPSIAPRVPPNKNSSKITFIKPTVKTAAPTNFNDAIEVPTRPNNDAELLLTSLRPLESDTDDNNIPLQDKEDDVERITNQKEYDPNPENLGKIKTEFRQSQSETSSVKVIFVAIATVWGVATLAIISVFVVKKYRNVRCRNRRMMSGNGDSQSDVRFLTADEVLDFNLDNDDF